jgi:2,4-dienoyl-CoA reductase-like NADH-dependent reductase (Old Yellow Enzyme family)
MKFGEFPKVQSLGSVDGLRAHLARLGLNMPCDDQVESGPGSPLAQPIVCDGLVIGNRLGINPMEGWDAQADGNPSEHTQRRWRRFGESGGKLIWGGEAVAVRSDGRANPRQLYLADHTVRGIAALRQILVEAHRNAMGDEHGLVVGLQLTHSGRFCKPNDNTRFESQIAFRHPLLDHKFAFPSDRPVLSDDALSRLVDDYVRSARWAQQCGYDFVDIKHCHGYLLHELLAAHTREGRYGGALDNRMRLLREIVAGIRAEAPGMRIGVRLSAIDIIPYRPDPAHSSQDAPGPGIPEPFEGPYRYGFGVAEADPTQYDLAEPKAFLAGLQAMGIHLVNITAGSPYYNPHVTRPAAYPPSDGYHPPEDPLAGVMRQIAIVRELKQAFPGLLLMSSGFTYLQDFMPNVAQAVVRQGWTDVVGIGRMVLSYPELPRDVMAGRVVQKKRICRTFSDCTTAPRNGLVSGCYPLDALYKQSDQFKTLAAIKKPPKTA